MPILDILDISVSVKVGAYQLESGKRKLFWNQC